MDTVDIKYAEQHLAELIERAAKGEDVLITENGEVKAKISVAAAHTQKLPQRNPGRWKALVDIPDDVLLAPMTAEELKEWYGEAG
jgi:prevent-host-death family protein